MSPSTIPTDVEHKAYIDLRTEQIMKAFKASGDVHREFVAIILESVYNRAVLDHLSTTLNDIRGHGLTDPGPEAE